MADRQPGKNRDGKDRKGRPAGRDGDRRHFSRSGGGPSRPRSDRGSAEGRGRAPRADGKPSGAAPGSHIKDHRSAGANAPADGRASRFGRDGDKRTRGEGPRFGGAKRRFDDRKPSDGSRENGAKRGFSGRGEKRDDKRGFSNRGDRRDDRRGFAGKDRREGAEGGFKGRSDRGEKGFERTARSDRSPSNRPDRAGRSLDGGSAKPRRFDGAKGKAASKDRVKKAFVPRNKKAFNERQIARLVDDTAGIYRGELDPKLGQRTKIAPGRNTREKLEELREVEREKRAGEKKGGGPDTNEDGTVRFYKNAASPARLAALQVTRIVRMREAYAQEVIETVVDSSDMSEADRAFATLLSLGVVSTYGVLDEVINRALDRPADAFSDVRDALRISTYELIFLGKQPHAAIDQGVELVRAISPSAHGLGNAILHRIERMRGEFPFGDPNTDIDALARVYAFPKWMTRRLVEDMGAKDAATFLRVSNDPAPLFIAVNALKATDGEVIEAFSACDAALTPVLVNGTAVAGCFHVSNPRVLAEDAIARLFEDGKILVSDASAQLIASRVLGDEKPASVLEVGAGRGTKTILIQSDAQRRFGSQVDLTSLDLHEFKVDLLRDRAHTYGADLSDALVGNATRLEAVLGDRTFATVFVDAPCSGLGTLRRHPEIRWRINKENIDAVGETSFAMLCSAAEHVEEGGRLVFSTCTVIYDENTGMVKRFLESPVGSRFALAPIDGAPCISTKLDEGSPDAHFAACFVRKG